MSEHAWECGDDRDRLIADLYRRHGHIPVRDRARIEHEEGDEK